MMETLTGCRSCGSEELIEILDLGRVPLANALLREADLVAEELRFPLTLLFCGRCALVQIRETISPDVLFSNYYYLSSFSETMLAQARKAADAFTDRFGLGAESLVVEIASNDGYLLENFLARDVPVLGIDPARNIAGAAEQKGVPTLCEFFGLELATRLVAEGRRADLVLGNNVIAHVADLNGVAAGIAELLKPSGVAVLEFPYLGEMIERVEFDTIYHEHLCYFSLHAIRALFERHDLRLFDVERLPIHGGSLRIFLRPQAVACEVSAAVEQLEAAEHESGMTEAAYYRGFADRVEQLKRQVLTELARRKSAGQSLVAYGASAKGSTLMNYFGLGRETFDYVVDRSTVKPGMYTPGNHLPILAPQELLDSLPDAALLLTWNFPEEIFRQQAEYLNRGGEFIVPLPEVRTVRREIPT